ncbi:uncharacterized protein K452DRAFT_147478 [Aplosporella prunicola CBS 121167]|uniref:Secreted protein n=1 Tax=Aplosporella prunicola CBS 121167 TaxID=1176127 RepID=A0A6A6BPM9_9PEZI|nr:uncharacterized protein K452DRAFT_147478 [Aplosporella prunicola CBS 121167]KAF2144787.1 hypothetical protein K452DRAFT_147478 [Aplosporella prunicola CBS 121167]
MYRARAPLLAPRACVCCLSVCRLACPDCFCTYVEHSVTACSPVWLDAYQLPTSTLTALPCPPRVNATQAALRVNPATRFRVLALLSFKHTQQTG